MFEIGHLREYKVLSHVTSRRSHTITYRNSRQEVSVKEMFLEISQN